MKFAVENNLKGVDAILGAGMDVSSSDSLKSHFVCPIRIGWIKWRAAIQGTRYTSSNCTSRMAY